MTPKDVIKGFANTETLMRHCRIKIFGSGGAAPPNGTAPIMTWKVSMEDADVIGFTTGRSGAKGQTKHRAFARIMKSSTVAKAKPDEDEFNAYYVPMVQTADVARNHSHYVLPSAGGPDIMVTSQITGCRFGIGSDSTGATLVSHMQPDSKVGDALRQADLALNSAQGFVQQGGSAVHAIASGSTYDQADKVTVIGIRTGGVWHFYQQQTDDPGLVQQKIKNVTMVY